MEHLRKHDPTPADIHAPIRMLILDDVAVDRALIQRMCSKSRLDMAIATAATLDDFVRLLDQASFDFVIVDMRLCVGSGLDALAMLEVMPLESQPVSLIVSDVGCLATARAAIAAGSLNYLLKADLVPSAFIEALGRALRQKIDRVHILSNLGPSDPQIAAKLRRLVAIAESMSRLSFLPREEDRAPPRGKRAIPGYAGVVLPGTGLSAQAHHR